jgi:hypothetical protein
MKIHKDIKNIMMLKIYQYKYQKLILEVFLVQENVRYVEKNMKELNDK